MNCHKNTFTYLSLSAAAAAAVIHTPPQLYSATTHLSCNNNKLQLSGADSQIGNILRNGLEAMAF